MGRIPSKIITREKIMNEFPLGYWQAISNLAWNIMLQGKETMEPFLEANPELYIDMDIDDEMELGELADLCDVELTSEQLQIWEELDEIFITIMETYNASYDDVWNHTIERMYEYDSSGGYFFTH